MLQQKLLSTLAFAMAFSQPALGVEGLPFAIESQVVADDYPEDCETRLFPAEAVSDDTSMPDEYAPDCADKKFEIAELVYDLAGKKLVMVKPGFEFVSASVVIMKRAKVKVVTHYYGAFIVRSRNEKQVYNVSVQLFGIVEQGDGDQMKAIGDEMIKTGNFSAPLAPFLDAGFDFVSEDKAKPINDKLAELQAKLQTPNIIDYIIAPIALEPCYNDAKAMYDAAKELLKTK